MCIEKEKRNNNPSKSTQATHNKNRKSQHHKRFPRQQQYRKVTPHSWGKLPRSASDPSFELRRREEKSLLESFTKQKLSKEEVLKRANEAVKIADDAVAHVTSIVADLSAVSSWLAANTAATVAAAGAIKADKVVEFTKVACATGVAVDVALRGAATARRVVRQVSNTLSRSVPDTRPSIASSNTRKSLLTAALEEQTAEAKDAAASAARFAARSAGISANLAEIISVSASAAIQATAAAVSAGDAEKTAEKIKKQSLLANKGAVEIADRAYHGAKRMLNSLNSFLERRTQMPPPPLPQISSPRQQYQCTQPQCSPTHDRLLSFLNFRWASQNYSPKTISRINDEICAQIDSIKSKVLSDPEINEIKDKLDESVRAVLSEKFELEIYGSYRTGLCIPTSDLDLSIDVECDPSYNKWQLNDEKLRIMRLLAKHLENETWVRHFKPLLNAKYPVLKLTGVLNNTKQIKIDITVEFKKVNGHPSDTCQAADLILTYKKKYPALEHLTLIVKKFFVEWGLDDTYRGYPNSHCIVIMIVTFLGYAYRTYLDNGASAPQLGALLIDFFTFYGYHFNYLQMEIRYNYKDEYLSFETIDDERSSRYWRKTSQWGPTVVIYDPIVEENDVGSNFYQFPKVKQAFQVALTNFQFLTKNSRVTNAINKSYLEAFLDKEICLQRHNPVQSSPSYNMQIPRQYSDQRAPRWESMPIHSQPGYYVPNFFHEADHTFFQPQILSSGHYY